jgi:hypothetical protein
MRNSKQQNGPAPVEDRGLSRKEAAKFLGVKPSLLANWAVFGSSKGPKFRKLHPGRRGTIVYMLSDLIQWIESRPTGGGAR